MASSTRPCPACERAPIVGDVVCCRACFRRAGRAEKTELYAAWQKGAGADTDRYEDARRAVLQSIPLTQ